MSAMASPPVVRSGFTMFRFSASPMRLSASEMISRLRLCVRSCMKSAHSKSSMSAVASQS